MLRLIGNASALRHGARLGWTVPRAISGVAAQKPQSSIPQPQQWKDGAAASALPPIGSSSATSKHLDMVSQAIQKVLEEKESAKIAAAAISSKKGVTSTETEATPKKDATAEKVEVAWQMFDNAFENAKSCIKDVAALENPDHWQEEIDTAEQALSHAQAAYLDLLETSREMTTEEAPTTPASRDGAAASIRKLRQQLDLLQHERQQQQQI